MYVYMYVGISFSARTKFSYSLEDYNTKYTKIEDTILDTLNYKLSFSIPHNEHIRI